MLFLLWSREREREGGYPADSIEDFDKLRLGAQKVLCSFHESLGTLFVEYGNSFTWTLIGA
jgi:hypothetical protein